MPDMTRLTERRGSMDIKPIRAEADYERALRRVEELWDAPDGSAESDELEMLAALIEVYEREHYPMEGASAEVLIQPGRSGRKKRRNGVPLLPARKGRRVRPDLVNRLRDELP
jgi:hypothetical protein